jgi:4-cresol dehydrogenase (hydroxylating) flavoprotein subunit
MRVERKTAVPKEAIEAWIHIVGSDRVLTDVGALQAHQQNVTEFERAVPIIIRPKTCVQLLKVVEIAARYAIPVTPVSQGKNWGLGSGLPVNDGTAIIRLDCLNRIVTVSERLRYAVIEPGVTQGQLAAYLRANHPSLIFNMTGSGLDTSIVGNVLERGGAIFGQRIHDLCGLEVLLADGSVVRTGLWHFDVERCQHHYSHGLGPDLNGLFAQSNLGIVLKMVIRLRPQAHRRLVCIRVDHDHVASLVDSLFYLREDQIISGGPVLVNRSDHRILGGTSMRTAQDEWIAVTTLTGSSEIMEACQGELTKRLGGISCLLSFHEPEQLSAVDPDEGDLLPFLRAQSALFDGQPSNFSLDAFRALSARKSGTAFGSGHYELDRDPDVPGITCVLPAVPFTGSALVEVVHIVREFSARYSLRLGLSFLAHDATTLEGFFRVTFDRTSRTQVAAAQDWSRSLYTVLESRGFLPYRLDIQSMPLFAARGNDPFWQTVSRIKNALDPGGILSPGRYGP